MIPRWMHRLWAAIAGYFWLPCPRCGRMFGGHERHGGTKLVAGRMMICCYRCPQRDDPQYIPWPTDGINLSPGETQAIDLDIPIRPN